jgi:hypothetical protein
MKKSMITADGIPVLCAHTALIDPRLLTPHPQNPKRHSPAKQKLYAKVIRPPGQPGAWRKAIVVSNLSGFIIAGHGAQLAAVNELNVSLVPVDLQNFASVEEEKAAMLADNWLAESTVDYDQDLLVELMDELKGAGLDLELAGVMAQLESADANELRELTIPPAPRMSWVLVGIPTVRFGNINGLVEKIARVPGTVLETAVNNTEPNVEENRQS